MGYPTFIPFIPPLDYPEFQRHKITREYYELLDRRRIVRKFSSDSISLAIIDDCIRNANSATSVANLQPCHFCIIIDPSVKSEIRLAAEMKNTNSIHIGQYRNG